MKVGLAAGAFCLCATALFAQDLGVLQDEITVTPLDPPRPISTAGQALAAEVRVLDRMTGEVVDLTLTSGAMVARGSLEITLDECRFPLANPAADAFALLQISDTNRRAQVFAGWMVASSPGLNPLDHSRYDVWVLRCANTS